MIPLNSIINPQMFDPWQVDAFTGRYVSSIPAKLERDSFKYFPSII